MRRLSCPGAHSGFGDGLATAIQRISLPNVSSVPPQFQAEDYETTNLNHTAVSGCTNLSPSLGKRALFTNDDLGARLAPSGKNGPFRFIGKDALSWRIWGYQGMLSVYVISIDEDRRAPLISSLASVAGVEAHVVMGVVGSTLPDTACRLLTQSDTWKSRRGTIGCFLGHVSAWERAANSSAPYSIILEDDVSLIGFERIHQTEIPQDADIIYIHDKISPNPQSTGDVDVRPFIEGLRVLSKKNEPSLFGFGYILTKIGAKKLLSALKTDYFYGHVDGRLLRYSTPEDSLNEFPESSVLRYVINNHHHKDFPPQIGLLKSYCISPALVFPRITSSMRELIDTQSMDGTR